MPSLLQNAQLITKYVRRYYKMPQNNVLKANKFALEASLLGQIIVLRTSNFLEATISRSFLDRNTLYIASIFAEKKKTLVCLAMPNVTFTETKRTLFSTPDFQNVEVLGLPGGLIDQQLFLRRVF